MVPEGGVNSSPSKKPSAPSRKVTEEGPDPEGKKEFTSALLQIIGKSRSQEREVVS